MACYNACGFYTAKISVNPSSIFTFCKTDKLPRFRRGVEAALTKITEIGYGPTTA